MNEGKDLRKLSDESSESNLREALWRSLVLEFVYQMLDGTSWKKITILEIELRVFCHDLIVLCENLRI